MDPGSHIGATIRVRRIDLGMTCAELARRVGVSYSLMNKIERADRDGSNFVLTKVARELGCTVDQLVEPPAATADVA